MGRASSGTRRLTGFLKDGLYEDVASIAALPGHIWNRLVYEYQTFSPTAAALSFGNPVLYHPTKFALKWADSAPATAEFLSRQFQGLDADTVVRLFAGDFAGLEEEVSPELLLFARVIHELARDLLETARSELENLTPEQVAEGMGRIYGFLLYTAAGLLLSAGAATALKGQRIVALAKQLRRLPGLKSPAARKAIDKLMDALRLLEPPKRGRADPPTPTAPPLAARPVEEATEIADDLFVDVAPNTSGRMTKVVDSGLDTSDALDVIDARSFRVDLAKDPLARSAYTRIRNKGVDVELEWRQLDTATNLAGEVVMREGKPVAIIYMQNNQTMKEALSTLVHESRHIDDVLRYNLKPGALTEHLPNSLGLEYRALRREEWYRLGGQRPSLEWRQQLRKQLQREGYDVPHRPRLFEE